MKQTNLKSDKIAALLNTITSLTGESKVEAVTIALEERLQNLEAKTTNAEQTLEWLRSNVWAHKGDAPTKEEQETLLGF